LLQTPLHALHLELGARMVPFAGYAMPVQYPAGVMAEHLHTRSAAGLFDVSHMGQLRLAGPRAAAALESLMPVDVIDLAPGRQRYGMLLNGQGGILDDLMFVNRDVAAGGDIFVIVNGACKTADMAHIQKQIGDQCDVIACPERALLALQGPQAAAVMERLSPGIGRLVFMTGGRFQVRCANQFVDCFVTRSGYTGEDGFEISVPLESAADLARVLLAEPEVKPAGLGARDTLRLEAGLCLYGHDIDTTTSPVEAGLTWAIQKVRRPGGARAGGYPGAAAIESQLATAPMRRRVGLVGLERVPVREGAELFDARGHKIGRVTSGTVGPTVGQPIAMGWLGAEHAQAHHEVLADVRGKRLPMRVTPLPFTPHRYHRG
jgi:aminomethyltransferase